MPGVKRDMMDYKVVYDVGNLGLLEVWGRMWFENCFFVVFIVGIFVAIVVDLKASEAACKTSGKSVKKKCKTGICIWLNAGFICFSIYECRVA